MFSDYEKVRVFHGTYQGYGKDGFVDARMVKVFVPSGDDSEKLDAMAKSASLLIAKSADGYDIARRSPEELLEILQKRQAVVAMLEDEVVGFVYFKKWNGDWLSVSGLVVKEELRGFGIGRALLFELCEQAILTYPDGKVFLLTTSQAVIKMALGFIEADLTSLSDDQEFWNGCMGCRQFNEIQAVQSFPINPCGTRCCCRGFVKTS